MLASAVAAAATPLVNHLLISAAGLGLNGAAVAIVCLQALTSALLLGAAAWHNRRCPAGAKPWAGPSWEAFAQLPAYLAVALPATGMMARATPLWGGG
jgi:multidrug resistance protein, MATE family